MINIEVKPESIRKLEIEITLYQIHSYEPIQENTDNNSTTMSDNIQTCITDYHN